MYQVVEITSAKQTVEFVTRTFKRDFEYREMFLTLSLNSGVAETDELVEEESKYCFEWWLNNLMDVTGFIYWNENRLDCSKEAGIRKISSNDKEGFVILYDPNAIVQLIAMRKSVYSMDEERVLSMFNKFANEEIVDITTLVSPAIYIEVYPE
jgi:Sec7-like guanine-nucleotide exchange factor